MVTRVRRVSVASAQVSEQLPDGFPSTGFGSVPGESVADFHDRMFDIPALEAMSYETELAIARCEMH